MTDLRRLAEAATPDLARHIRRLQRNARTIRRTYVGTHWPTTRDARRDGIGFGLAESREHEAAVRKYVSDMPPDLMADLMTDVLRYLAAYDRAAYALDAATERVARLEAALTDAFETMDAACRWAATQTGGIKTLAEADAHMKGYDALLDGTVRAGEAAGRLHLAAVREALAGEGS